MMKVYIPDEYATPVLGVTRRHALPFELEKDKFVVTRNVQEAQVIPVIPNHAASEVKKQADFLGPIRDDQLVLLMFHTHSHEGDSLQMFENHRTLWDPYAKNSRVVHLNRKLSDYGIFYDFCFNYVKSHFVDYDKFDLADGLWTRSSTKAMFDLDEIIRKPPHRTFLSPNRVSKNRESELRNSLRAEIHAFIPSQSTWRGDPENGFIIYPQECSPLIFDDLSTGGMMPAHNTYYQQSFVSVFTETIVYGPRTRSLTEKTYIPLIKGHFILPYGYKGMISDIRNKGFLLPNWIDYSYDELDDDVRFEAFKGSMTKVLQYTEQELMALFYEDKYILEHNRNKFYVDDYDSLYESIMKL